MGRGKRFSKKEEEEICKLYLKRKLDCPQIAKKLGCSYGTVGNAIRRNGFKLRDRSEAQKLFSRREEKEVCKLYLKKKLSCPQIAKELGCSSTVIGCVLRRDGFKLRSRSEALKGKNGLFSEKEERKICRMYLEEGLSTSQIAKKFGCSFSTIKGIIRRRGFKLRSPGETLKLFSKEEEKYICKLYLEKGLNTYQIAKKFGCSSKTIGRILRWNNFKLRSLSEARKGSCHSVETKRKIREKRLLHLQNHPGPWKDTKLELKMKKILIFLKLPFIHQFRIAGIKHLFDFYLFTINLLIETDGKYWHTLPGRRRKDYRINKLVRRKGYRILRFWERDILKNKEKVIQKLSMKRE